MVLNGSPLLVAGGGGAWCPGTTCSTTDSTGFGGSGDGGAGTGGSGRGCGDSAAAVERKKWRNATAAKIPFVLVKDGYTEKSSNEIKHNELIKDFKNFDKIIKKYL